MDLAREGKIRLCTTGGNHSRVASMEALGLLQEKFHCFVADRFIVLYLYPLKIEQSVEVCSLLAYCLKFLTFVL